jgi:hypothetical protein
MRLRLCIALFFAAQFAIGQQADTDKSRFIETHRADPDLLAAFRGGSAGFPIDVQQLIVAEYLGVEYEVLQGSGKPSQQEVRRIGVEALRDYLGHVAAADEREIPSLRSIFLDKMGKGALTFPGQKRYGMIVVESSPQAAEVIVNSEHFAGTIGKLCVLPGSYTVTIKRPNLAACTIHIQVLSPDVKTVSCK